MSVTLVPRLTPRLIPADSPPAGPLRAWLAQLPGGLPPFAPRTAAPSESCTPAEAHAAARAVACPDLFLIHAADPLAGERVIAEVARLAAERVLILSPNPAAADRLTERLAGHGVVRALADDENPIRPSPVVARLTSAALGAGRVEQLQRAAADAVAAAETRLAAFNRRAELALRLGAIEDELAELTAERNKLHENARAAIDREAVVHSVRLHAAQETPPPTWIRELEQLPAELARKQAALGDLRQQHTAATGRKSGLFARLFRKTPSSTPDAGGLGQQVQALETEIATLEARLAEGRAESEKRISAELDRLTGEKRTALLAESEPRYRALGREHNELREAMEELDRQLLTAPARDTLEQELGAARDRQAELTAPDLARRFLARASVVVGTPGSLQADPVFEALAASGSGFALLILDRCEELTEPDFTRLATLAERWVLVGEAQSHPETHSPRPSLGNGKPGRNGRAAETSFAGRLARLLDREQWIHEANQLVCRLMHPSTPAARQSLVREPLLDRPEIELRFATDGDGELVVAEVAFPRTTPIAEAKAFLFQELGEVLLHPCGEHRWDDSTELMARWAPIGDAMREGTWINLEPGVRELVVGTGLAAFTAAIAFDPAAGWDRERAEAWLTSHLPRETASRVAVLPGEGTRR